jgi:tripeptide aminopeptidase
MDKVVQTFLDLAAIDEVHPNEKEVLAYIMRRLRAANVPYQQDEIGNIVARIEGTSGEAIAFCGHVDIAAPLNARKIITEGNLIKTDGVSLLGGDDKTAVAGMLELADELAGGKKPVKTIELIFTVGEENGMMGARHLDVSQLQTKQMLVFDWLGRVNRTVTQSPAYIKLDVTYIGKDAHPAEWQNGKNAGAALMEVAAGLQQGEYSSGVTFNIGIVEIGNARNKVPGHAHLKAEVRSTDTAKAQTAAKEIEQIFQDGAKQHHIMAEITVDGDSHAYRLNQQGPLFMAVQNALATLNLKPELEQTYGCFDGNILAAKGLDVVMLGAGYYNPHGPDEYVNIDELVEMSDFMRHIATAV